MNENDLSDLVFKNKKEWGFQNKAHTCKKCTKATPASKKILVLFKKRSLVIKKKRSFIFFLLNTSISKYRRGVILWEGV